MPLPEVGADAPLFNLPDQDGSMVSLQQFQGHKNVLIYFYPRAFTPGCTKQACGIRDSSARFDAANTVVLGISTDPVERLKKFRQKHALDFTLLSDEDHAVADAYGVWGERSFLGKIFNATGRSSFIINKDGKIAHVMAKANPGSHDGDALAFIQSELS